ncbi:Inositol polyphosphate multikinase beta [Apostasia shenzhenica]|uniref:Inositol polyphosphate multikinase n=1 Tax=Apostasia shenzhenica TaxID=1088818 RepID=A0A2I0AMZ4_9ASPA|nr:Inositol polyphosphate multikinase beta [Apostasia shenzhenica]
MAPNSSTSLSKTTTAARTRWPSTPPSPPIPASPPTYAASSPVSTVLSFSLPRTAPVFTRTLSSMIFLPVSATPLCHRLKIGARTWFPSVADDYFRKCLDKGRKTTSALLGFCVSGVQIRDDRGILWRPSHGNIHQFTASDVRRTLRRFVSSNPTSDCEPNCAFASAVYSGSEGLLAQLLELKAWFENQTLFHFYSTSVLAAYDNDDCDDGQFQGRPRLRLIDFAHVLDSDGVIDHNFLGGICSLIKFISEIFSERIEEDSNSDSVRELEQDRSSSL